jgi:hypothetical protein
MALIVKDRVQETTSTTGTGTLTLSGAVSGYQTFSSAIGNTNTTYYSIGKLALVRLLLELYLGTQFYHHLPVLPYHLVLG